MTLKSELFGLAAVGGLAMSADQAADQPFS
jgi:hypothetical protein